MKQVTITIPATTANLGPGFDCLGLALGLYNYVTFTATDETEPQSANLPAGRFHITVEGVDAAKVPTDSSNLVAQTATLLFDLLGKRPSHLQIHQHNNIPVGSGLGSSSTAVLAGLLGANAIVNGNLTQSDLLQIAT
ncbi:MAG: hypothetical protein KC421_03585, partial [Anaerolineales bacterium]|nr:hypothetical protein [Anaerolineales bacterium]